jgi:prepilin-type N-terminal cleavage/methylation domain-containing protein
MDGHLSSRPGTRGGNHEGGFTLIELMTVVLIIAILVAIAIPTFYSARERAQDRSAQSLLRDSMVAARSLFTDASTYTGIGPAQMQSEEASIDYLDDASDAAATANEVSVETGPLGNASYVVLASGSASGRCYGMLHVSDAATRYRVIAGPGCKADDFDPGAATWTNSWG